LELLTYRRTGHSRRDPCHYQSKDEREQWAANDPIDRFGQVLVERGNIDEQGLKAIREGVIAEFNNAVAAARRQPMPTIDDLTTDVFAPAAKDRS